MWGNSAYSEFLTTLTTGMFFLTLNLFPDLISKNSLGQWGLKWLNRCELPFMWFAVGNSRHLGYLVLGSTSLTILGTLTIRKWFHLEPWGHGSTENEYIHLNICGLYGLVQPPSTSCANYVLAWITEPRANAIFLPSSYPFCAFSILMSNPTAPVCQPCHAAVWAQDARLCVTVLTYRSPESGHLCSHRKL